jgi:Fur family transcriptional regulator, peroxide stress response regulator
MSPAAVEALFRARGWSVTGPRRAIVQHLNGNSTHPTAAQVYAAVRLDWPGLSRATVYNTLGLLVELGAVRPLREPGADTRFDPNDTPHHHRVCPSCGQLFDVALDEVVVHWQGRPRVAQVRILEACEACA